MFRAVNFGDHVPNIENGEITGFSVLFDYLPVTCNSKPETRNFCEFFLIPQGCYKPLRMKNNIQSIGNILDDKIRLFNEGVGAALFADDTDA